MNAWDQGIYVVKTVDCRGNHLLERPALGRHVPFGQGICRWISLEQVVVIQLGGSVRDGEHPAPSALGQGYLFSVQSVLQIVPLNGGQGVRRRMRV